eukprot:Lankesteria_metandrocarpae@DN3480_c0_g1_i3.p1
MSEQWPHTTSSPFEQGALPCESASSTDLLLCARCRRMRLATQWSSSTYSAAPCNRTLQCSGCGVYITSVSVCTCNAEAECGSCVRRYAKAGQHHKVASLPGSADGRTSPLMYIPPTHYCVLLYGLGGNADDFVNVRHLLLQSHPNLHVFNPGVYSCLVGGGIWGCTAALYRHLVAERRLPNNCCILEGTLDSESQMNNKVGPHSHATGKSSIKRSNSSSGSGSDGGGFYSCRECDTTSISADKREPDGDHHHHCHHHHHHHLHCGSPCGISLSVIGHSMGGLIARAFVYALRATGFLT